MNILVVLLTAVLLLVCVLLILLVLIQLPKKEAGMGLAFGAGATDALFGAGSGNALTQLTKYSAIGFFGLVILLSILAQSAFKRDNRDFEQRLKAAAQQASESAKPAATTAAGAVATVASNGNVFKSLTTNAAVAPLLTATNKPAAAAPAAQK